MSICTGCQFTQYCRDCKLESSDMDSQDSTFSPKISSHVRPPYFVIEKGRVRYKNMVLNIIGFEKGDPNTRIYTKDFVFCVREKGGKAVLIKATRINKENRKPESNRRRGSLLKQLNF